MNTTQYSGSSIVDTSRRRSNFWADARVSEILAGNLDGFRTFHDFDVAGTITESSTQAALVGLPYAAHSGTTAGTTITVGQVKNAGGELILSSTTTGEGNVVRNLSCPFWLSANAGSLWFEARVKLSNLLTTECSLALGLMDATAASATVPLTMSTGAIADVNFVGFHKPSANTTAFDTSYKADGVTLVEVNSDIGALVADTYVKLGMKFDRATKLLTFYINGVKQAGTKAIPNNTGTDFPADVALCPVIAMCTVAGGDNVVTMDWWECVQHYAA